MLIVFGVGKDYDWKFETNKLWKNIVVDFFI